MNIHNEYIIPNKNHSNELLPSFYFRFYSRMFNSTNKIIRNKKNDEEQKKDMFRTFTNYLKFLKKTNENIKFILEQKKRRYIPPGQNRKRGNEMHNFLRIGILQKNTYNEMKELGTKIINYFNGRGIKILSMNKNLEDYGESLKITTKHSEFYKSVHHHGNMNIVEYNKINENGTTKTIKKMYKYIVNTSKKRDIDIKLAKVFIEFTIHSILEYIYNLYLPSLDYLAFYNTENLTENLTEKLTEKLIEDINTQPKRRTENIKIVMEYIDSKTLNEYIKDEVSQMSIDRKSTRLNSSHISL